MSLENWNPFHKAKKVAKETLVAGATLASMAAAGQEAQKAPDFAKEDVDKKIEMATQEIGQKIGEQDAHFRSGFDSGEHPTLAVYTHAATPEGGVTPTGLSNSFLENPYHITVADLPKIAERFGFSTESELAFQSDLVDFIEANHPEIISKAMELFGETNHAKEVSATLPTRAHFIEGLKDGKIGVRTAFFISYLNTLPPVEKPSTPEISEPAEPRGDFIVNVRGDWNDGRGAYYFFENEADFDAFVKKVDHFAHVESIENGTKKQVTYDMDQNVFKAYHANTPELQTMLGQAWLRDPKNPNHFYEKKSWMEKPMAVAHPGY